LYYDRSKPYTKVLSIITPIRQQLTADKPLAYVIPQAWGKVIDLFKLNGVAMQQLAHDTTLNLQMYYIGDYKTGSARLKAITCTADVKLNPVDMSM
jgi:hypothetical protein